MNITEAELYWITRLDSISDFLIGLIVVAVIFLIGYIIWLGESMHGNMEDFPLHKLRRALIVFGIMVFAVLLTNTMLPSTKDMLLIKGVPAIANSESLQEFVQKDLPAYCKLFLEKQLNEKQDKIVRMK